VEVEAWEAPATTANVALEANGGQATASSTYSASYPARATINGETKGIGWGAGSDGWNDGSAGDFTDDTLTIQFNGEKRINEIDLFTLQDNYVNPVTPTLETTFTQFGVTSFRVDCWDSANSQWVLLSDVTNNNKVWRRLEFAPLRTRR
jgi:hypothetical protein